MNFDFSDDLKQLRDQARRFLSERSPPSVVRSVLEARETYAADLWRAMAEMGWLGAAIPEQYGGAGLGYEGLCVLAEELGRSLAPVPFASSAYLASEAVLLAGSQPQKARILPSFADGSTIGCFALTEGSGNPNPGAVQARCVGGRLTGSKWPVSDGSIADLAVVAARDEAGEIAFYLADLTANNVSRRTLRTVDPSRDHARIDFAGADVERLSSETGWPVVLRILERAAILIAFEQVGGADASLEMARNYALERYAFGRPIGSFQAIKHKLADVYVATRTGTIKCLLRRLGLVGRRRRAVPGCGDGARVGNRGIPSRIEGEHPDAWRHRLHLGRWTAICIYRRSKQLALALGGAPCWKNRLVELLEMRNAA